MLTRLSWQWVVALFLIGLSVALSAAFYSTLPETVPTHWNAQGDVDGFGSKNVATLLMPATMTGMLVLFAFLPALSPKNFEVDTFKSTFLYVMAVTVALLAYLHAVILYGTWSYVHGFRTFDMGRMLFAGIFLFFALLGNVMGKVRRNFYIGVRVPWTLASDRVWNDTHRFAAWTMVGGGVIGFLFVITGMPILISVAVLLISIFLPIAYSFLHYKQLEKRGAL